MYGTLYGIGVGPGDPDLLTIKAVKTLARADVVFAASSTKNDYSVSLSIARPHMRANVEIRQLGFPMLRDKEQLRKAWSENAAVVAEHLAAGKNCAFLTLGDPLIYSTFGYLMQTLRTINPDLPVEVVPGITSYQAAAARTRTVLCESGENLLLLSGVGNGLDKALDFADNAVILKTYKNFTTIRDTIVAAKKDSQSTFISRLGMDGEVVAESLAEAPERPHYFSLLLVTGDKKRRNGWE
ncbi:precorrin-2 C(20)-methyltransferase [Oleidesulfovibrio sp.]|uniref:precorrin-2 C(20)-methyltransferase n=1 Tax=Oleidesulfovibrio sp. TaxID=2909707 RepID=UPI003A849B32